MSIGLGMTREEWNDLRSQVDDSFWVMRVIGELYLSILKVCPDIPKVILLFRRTMMVSPVAHTSTSKIGR